MWTRPILWQRPQTHYLFFAGGTSPSRHSDEERLRGCPEPVIDWDPGRAPLFYRDLRDVGCFFKDFIYLFERERQSVIKKGNPSRVVGEEEAGSSGEANDGLLPAMPGSRPNPKTGT